MATTSFGRRFTGAVVALALLAGGAACGASDNVGPEIDRLAGVYELSDWLYVTGTDSVQITEDSYLELDFVDDEHVVGEGWVWVLVPRQQDDGTVEYERYPFLFEQSGIDGSIEPLTLEGWYYTADGGEAPDTLHFRFGKSTGANSWVEAIDWALSEDRASFEYEWSTFGSEVNIVLGQR